MPGGSIVSYDILDLASPPLFWMLFSLLRYDTSSLSDSLPVLRCGKKHFLCNALTREGEFLTRARRIQLGKPKDLQNMLSPEASYFLDVIFIFLLQK